MSEFGGGKCPKWGVGKCPPGKWLTIVLIEDGFSICSYSKPPRQDSKRFILCCLFEIFNNNSFEQLCFNIRLCQSNNQWRGSFQKIQISLLPSLSTFQFTYSYISRPRDVSTSRVKVCCGALKLNDLFFISTEGALSRLMTYDNHPSHPCNPNPHQRSSREFSWESAWFFLAWPWEMIF